MNDAVKKRLLDAVNACEAIQRFVEGMDKSDYQKNDMCRSAVDRQLEIIGEALGQAASQDESLEEAIPSIPRIVALRNRVIHGYDTVDDEIVWDIVQTKVPPLKDQLEGALREYGS